MRRLVAFAVMEVTVTFAHSSKNRQDIWFGTHPAERKKKYMADAEIRKNVEAELEFEPSVNASEIGVAVKDGIVTLTGHVNSYWEKIAAEEAAARVSGVKAVADNSKSACPFPVSALTKI